MTVVVTRGALLFPDGNANGGVPIFDTSASSIAARLSPNGTFAAVPGSTVYYAHNLDKTTNDDPDDDSDFSSGSSRGIEILSMRSDPNDPFISTQNPFPIGAVVLTNNAQAYLIVNVSSDGNDTEVLIMSIPAPEPCGSGAMGVAAAIGMLRLKG